MKTYNENIDIIKGIAIILVVIGHIVQLREGTQHVVYQWIYKYHMDIFFFCSGLVFSGLDMKSGIQDVLTITKNKTFRLCVPYFVWTFIIFSIDKQSFTFSNIVDYLRYPKYGLWFLKSLFQYSIFVIIFYYIISLVKYCFVKKTELLFILSLLLLALVQSDSHFFYFIVGITFNRFSDLQEYLLNRFCVMLASVLLILSIFISKIPNYLIVASAILYIYNLGEKMPDKLKTQIVLMGKNSMPIFLLHILIIKPLMLQVPTEPFLLFLLCMIFSILISYMCLLLYWLTNGGILGTLLYGEKNNLFKKF